MDAVLQSNSSLIDLKPLKLDCKLYSSKMGTLKQFGEFTLSKIGYASIRSSQTSLGQMYMTHLK